MADLFDIPIYRCTQEKHQSESNAELKRRLEDIEFPRSEIPEAYQTIENLYWTRDWYPWKYNEVIGWIHLSTFVTNVHGDLFLVRHKRCRRRMKDKLFYMLPHVKFDVKTSKDHSPQEVYQNVRDAILKIMKKPRMKTRYVDLSVFDAIGPRIDWHVAIRQESK